MLRGALVMATTILFTACSSLSNEDLGPDLPIAHLDEFQEMLAASDRPVVVNVWASWCIPCREEAPLLTEALAEYGEQVSFIGLAFDDNQPGAKQFLAEFDLPFPHYFDQDGVILAEYGGLGIPRTYFFDPGGELVHTFNGVLDAATLALHIDELLGR
ncbi:hypothetical protein BH18ACT6_BH18ACT6_25950 [soil metagenome]